jgi:hypothetical protein
MLCGRVSYCSNRKYPNKVECLKNKSTWETPPQNYNNIFFSMLTFFEIQTLEDWYVPVFVAMDSSNDKDVGPILMNNQVLVLLYVVFVFMTTFFVLNTFITILIC